MLKLAPKGRAPVLCLGGPPGVGKTTLAESIARAIGRKFARVSLGGVHEAVAIRGHRHTYVGAVEGCIIEGIRRAGARNCVMLLDEIDKLGASNTHGDPRAALLEVLDPAQNSAFTDHYLGVPFDLSQVVFIATANDLDAIPGPLADRMEVIWHPGYTEEERIELARRHLLARQLKATGLKPEQVEVSDEALLKLVRASVEPGVRKLEQQIGKLLRQVVVRVAKGDTSRIRIEQPSQPE